MINRNFARNLKKALKEPGYAMRVLYKRALSSASFCFLNGASSWPETVSFFMTYDCNARCKFCPYWGKHGSIKENGVIGKEKLSLEVIKNVIDDIAFFKPNITLFGGEPSLYKEWISVVKHAKSRSLRVNMVTNGTLLGGIEEDVVDSGIDEIIFSIEGPEKIHDEATSLKGAFNKIISSFERISDIKKERNAKTPRMNIACVISESNYRYMEEMVAVASKLSADSITFHHLSFITRDVYGHNSDILKKFFKKYTPGQWSGFIREQKPDIDTEKLLSIMNKINDTEFSVPVFFYPDMNKSDIEDYYKYPDFLPSGFPHRCISPWITSYIFPDGSVGPCEELGVKCGNIKEESFNSIWNNKCYVDFRKALKKERFFPICPKCTEFYRS